ncbi:hypothetical protein ACFWDQ_38045, partial [Streptomyces sp. NPDC060053]
MPDIEIDTSRLTSPRFTVPEAGTGVLDGSATPPPTVSLPAGTGFHLRQDGLPAADFVFTVRADGTVDFDPALDAFLSGRGSRRLTVLGLPVTLDTTVLGHVLVLNAGGVTLQAGVQQLTLLPGSGYRLTLPSVTAGLVFGLTPDGAVVIDAETSRFATASGPTLSVQGFTITVDGHELSGGLFAMHSGSDLTNDAPHPLHLIPGTGYGFQAGKGGPVGSFRYGIELDGTITLQTNTGIPLDPHTNGFATADNDTKTLTIHGRTITIDGHELTHDLYSIWPPLLLPRTTTHQLRQMPAPNYGFQTGEGGPVGSFRYGIELDGTITLQTNTGIPLDPHT